MYDAICLASGGLDSLVCLSLMRRHSISVLPLFIDYGQRSRERELSSLQQNCLDHRFPEPHVLNVSGFGASIKTGLTDPSKPVLEEAFTPGRNLLFITLAASVAYTKGARNIVMGLLSERTTIFPDQNDRFLRAAEA